MEKEAYFCRINEALHLQIKAWNHEDRVNVRNNIQILQSNLFFFPKNNY